MTITVYLDNDTQEQLDSFCKAQGLGRGKGIKALLAMAGQKPSQVQEDQAFRADLLWHYMTPEISYSRDVIAFKAFEFGLIDGYATVRNFIQTGRLKKVNAKSLVRPEHLGFDNAKQQIAYAFWRHIVDKPLPGDELLIPANLLLSEGDTPVQPA